MEDENKRWTVKYKAAMVMEIIQCKTTMAEAIRLFDLPHLEIEKWVDEDYTSPKAMLRSLVVGFVI